MPTHFVKQPKLLVQILLLIFIFTAGVFFLWGKTADRGVEIARAQTSFKTILLDDFEEGFIRNTGNPDLPLWSQYEGDFNYGPDLGVASVSTDAAHNGTRSLKTTVTSGSLYLQFYTNDGSIWRWMREFTEPSSSWTNDTFNRMRFWIKAPQGLQKAPPGQGTVQVGTYVRKSNGDSTSAEDGGGHWYHGYNIGYTGEWEQIIFDTHPAHQRGGNGSYEWGDQEYVTGEAGFNYFDALTRFYIDMQDKLSSFPADFYVDGFELYQDTRPENIKQIYSLHGVYIPSTNEIQVGWARDKDENSISHEVRYAFQSVYDIGWNAAKSAPNGIITPPGWQGYNGMEWSTRDIDVTGYNVIYIAIKPENATLFREIAIPTKTVATIPTSPSIASQPQSKTVVEGQTAIFSVGANGTAPLAYQWMKNTVSITGATSASYTTPPVVSADTGSVFIVRVSNTLGSVTSNQATLTVQKPALATITVSPSAVTIQPNGAQQFTAQGKDQFGNQMSITPAWSASGGGTITQAGLFTAGAQDGGPFTITAKDTASGITGTAAVTIASITQQPLRAHWRFDEGIGTTAGDSAGNNAGAIKGATWTTGKTGNALNFNGVDDYVDVGTFDASGGTGLTIAFWMKADTFAISDARLISKSTSTAEQSHYFMVSTTGGPALRFRLKTGGTTTTLIASGATLASGVWTHGAATYDGSAMKIYKDGVQVGSIAKSGSMDANSTVPVWIGRNPDGYGPFDGQIDDVRIYQAALTQSEIEAVMNEGAGGGGGNQSPTVTVSAAPTKGIAPLTVNFTATATDPDGTIASYAWDFGDSQTSTQQNPSHIYSSAGSYTSAVMVTDNQNATGTQSVTITATKQQSSATTILLDDFEANDIRVVQPNETNPIYRYLWNQYEGDFTEGPDPGVEGISTDTARDGTRSLKITVTGGNLYLHFYPNDGVKWHWMREFTQPSSNWTNDTFNRMRFWMKVPPNLQKAPLGQGNLQIGTYLRKSTGDLYSAEDGGGHWYHFYNLGYTGEWEQIILDTHPNHQRGGSGGYEWGDQEYVTGEAGFNYFDALTRFYLDIIGKLPSFPADFYVDGFELYQETKPENIKQIYSLHGVYVPTTNEIYVGWMRDKDENSIKHEVKYAFQSVHDIGWNAAKSAPNGIITPPGWQGYNGMEWSTRDIDVTGYNVIYIAIKPENATLFREIAIPITSIAPVNQSPNVMLTKTVDKAEAQSGGTLTYTITYTNAGQGTAINIVITDPIPQGTTYIANSATSNGAYDGAKITWTIPTLAPNAAGSVSFGVTVK